MASRRACAEMTCPLVEAVESLTTFASSPQFASTPTKISAQARQAQEPIIVVSGRVECESEEVGDVIGLSGVGKGMEVQWSLDYRTTP